jgi:hypothetical protein
MGIDTVVVRDRAYDGTALIEDTEDWFAQDVDGNVWYFGENTAECAGGNVTNRAGAWEAGLDGAMPGIVMLASPRLGDYYRQEFYEGYGSVPTSGLGRVQLRRREGHDDVLVTEDFTALEPGQLEYKSYAGGRSDRGNAVRAAGRRCDRRRGNRSRNRRRPAMCVALSRSARVSGERPLRGCRSGTEARAVDPR